MDWASDSGWWQVVATLVLTVLLIWVLLKQNLINAKLAAISDRKSLIIKRESDSVIKCVNTGTVDLVVRAVQIDSQTYRESKPQLVPAGAPEVSHIDILVNRPEISQDGMHSVVLQLSEPFNKKISHLFLGEYKTQDGLLIYTKSFGIIKK